MTTKILNTVNISQNKYLKEHVYKLIRNGLTKILEPSMGRGDRRLCS